MKKRSKKKLAKFGKWVGKGILKLVIVYPAKGLWKLTKWGFSKVRRSAQEKVKEVKTERKKRVVDSKRPRIQAKYHSLTELR